MVITEELLRRGFAFYSQGRLGEAEMVCRQFLDLNPTHAKANQLLALCLARTGRGKDAVSLLERLLEKQPMEPELHSALSSVLFFEGRHEDARQHGRCAIELSPNIADVTTTYARDLDAQGYDQEAKDVLSESLERNRNDVTFCRALKQYYNSIEARFEVEAMLRWIVELEPQNAVNWLDLAQFRIATGRYEDAIACAQRAIACDESSSDAHMMLGSLYSEDGDRELAAFHLRKAIELNENDSRPLAALGGLLQQGGNFGEGEQLLRKAVEVRPHNGYAHYLLSRSHKAQPSEDAMIERLDAMSSDPRATEIDRAYLRYAAAKGWEDLGEYKKSISSYDAANAAAYEFWFSRNPWDRSTFREFVTRTIETFTREFTESLQRDGLSTEVPILIVGMPRSGTTLIEQIISSHPDVAPAGEVEFWHKFGGQALDQREFSVDRSKLTELARNYLGLLTSTRPDARRVTDKMPHNFAALGLVCSALPNARVIHVRRNPADTCLSVYTTAFARPPSYALRREDIVFAYRQYVKMMEHWRRVLPPDRLLEVEYEELIADHETVSRRMIEFAGLPWDDACLHHEGNGRVVRTESVWQVRQPLYDSSIGRWLRFKPWLQEFAELNECLKSHFELM